MSDTPETDCFSDEEQAGTKNIWELYSLCRELERERNNLLGVIQRAKASFFEDGSDASICVNMLEILQEVKE